VNVSVVGMHVHKLCGDCQADTILKYLSDADAESLIYMIHNIHVSDMMGVHLIVTTTTYNKVIYNISPQRL